MLNCWQYSSSVAASVRLFPPFLQHRFYSTSCCCCCSCNPSSSSAVKLAVAEGYAPLPSAQTQLQNKPNSKLWIYDRQHTCWCRSNSATISAACLAAAAVAGGAPTGKNASRCASCRKKTHTVTPYNTSLITLLIVTLVLFHSLLSPVLMSPNCRYAVRVAQASLSITMQ